MIIKDYETKTKAISNLSALNLGKCLIHINIRDRGMSFVLS